MIGFDDGRVGGRNMCRVLLFEKSKWSFRFMKTEVTARVLGIELKFGKYKCYVLGYGVCRLLYVVEVSRVLFT